MVIFLLILLLIVVIVAVGIIGRALDQLRAGKAGVLVGRADTKYFQPMNPPKQLPNIPLAPRMGLFAAAAGAGFQPNGTTVDLNSPCWITGQKKAVCGCKECAKIKKAAN